MKFDMSLDKDKVDINKPIIIKQITETKIYPNGERYTKSYFMRDGVQNINTVARGKRVAQAKADKKAKTVNDIKVTKVEEEVI